MSFIVQVEKINDGRVPTKGTEGSVGYDLYSNENLFIPPGERKLVKTGIKLAPSSNDVLCLIKPRSSLAVKGIDIGAGVCDPDYRNEYKVLLINNSENTFHIVQGDRIAQLLFVKVCKPDFQEVEELNQTTRSGGFGSTGK